MLTVGERITVQHRDLEPSRMKVVDTHNNRIVLQTGNKLMAINTMKKTEVIIGSRLYAPIECQKKENRGAETVYFLTLENRGLFHH
jgi:hypothetical protein